MSLIAREWTIYPCPDYPDEHGWGTARGHCPWCNARLEPVVVVPKQPQGAVSALREIVKSADHPSPTINSTAYLRKLAADAIARCEGR